MVLPTINEVMMKFSIYLNVASRWTYSVVEVDSIISFFNAHVGSRIKSETMLVGLYQLKEGKSRSSENVDKVYAFGVDVDDGLTLEEAIERTKGLASFSYHTHSSTPEHHKFRMVFPLTRPMEGHEVGKVFRWMQGLLPEMDTSCKDAGRMFYLMSPNAATSTNKGMSLNVDRMIQDVDELRSLEHEARQRHMRDYDEATVKDIHTALNRIVPDVPYNILRSIVWALKDELGDEAYDMWDEWVSQSAYPEHNTIRKAQDDPDKVWKQFGESNGQTTIGTLFYLSGGNSEYSVCKSRALMDFDIIV